MSLDLLYDRGISFTALALLALGLLGSGCARCDCEISSSSTDRAAREAQLREREAMNRPFESYEQADWERRARAEYKAYEERFNARFSGRVVPGMGCEVCPWACEVWDLSAMDAGAYKVGLRESTRLMKYGETREERYIGSSENRRLFCVAGAHPARTRPPLHDLMDERESPAVRYEAVAIALRWNIDTAHAMAMLESLARGDDAEYAELADLRLDALQDAGVPDAATTRRENLDAR